MMQCDPANARDAGQKIKRLYAEHRKSTSKNGRYNPAKRYRTVELWDEVGALCCKLRVSPKFFLDAAIHGNKVPGGPFPDMLKSEGYMGRLIHELRGESTDPTFGTTYGNMKTDFDFKREELLKLRVPLDHAVEVLQRIGGYSITSLLLLDQQPGAWSAWSLKARRELGEDPEAETAILRLGADNAFVQRITTQKQ